MASELHEKCIGITVGYIECVADGDGAILRLPPGDNCGIAVQAALESDEITRSQNIPAIANRIIQQTLEIIASRTKGSLFFDNQARAWSVAAPISAAEAQDCIKQMQRL